MPSTLLCGIVSGYIIYFNHRQILHTLIDVMVCIPSELQQSLIEVAAVLAVEIWPAFDLCESIKAVTLAAMCLSYFLSVISCVPHGLPSNQKEDQKYNRRSSYRSPIEIARPGLMLEYSTVHR